MSSSRLDRTNHMAIDKPDSTVRAIMVEDPDTVQGMIAERAGKICDRCFDPNRTVAGIVFFMDAPSEVLAHLRRNDWALCTNCLDALKQRGAQALTPKRDWAT